MNLILQCTNLYKRFQRSPNQFLVPLKSRLHRYSNPRQSEFVHAATIFYCSRQPIEPVDVAWRASLYWLAMLAWNVNVHRNSAAEEVLWH